MNLTTDTSRAAQDVWMDVFRHLPPSRKWHMLDEAFAQRPTLARGGMAADASRRDGGRGAPRWMMTHFRLEANVMSPGSESLTGVLREVLEVFSKLDIAYALGGSMASSIHGIARFTLDADVPVDPFPGKEETLAAAFGPDYYLSLPAIQDAVRLRSSFNIIHTRAGFKVDVFVRKDDPFEESAMSRRQTITLTDKPEQPIAVLSPEDVILYKLQWYRLENETSRQQLDDVVGILRTRAGNLDEAYVAQWAESLSLKNVWEKVLAEV